LLKWVVEAPYDGPLPNLLKMSCNSSHLVIITPTLMTRRSKSRRKLLRSLRAFP